MTIFGEAQSGDMHTTHDCHSQIAMTNRANCVITVSTPKIQEQ